MPSRDTILWAVKLPAAVERGLKSFWHSRRSLLFFRNVAGISIAIVACLVPEVGPNRFWLAAALVFACVPLANLIEQRITFEQSIWVQPLFDLCVIVSLIHLVPDVWFTGLVIGLMVVQAPSVAEARSSSAFYALFAGILTAGMTFAAIVHDVPGWQLPVISMVVMYPSVIFYSYRQATRANELRKRAQALDGLQVVAGGVAHDFNNLLTGVIGNAEIALVETGSDHPAAEALDGVIQGAEQASLLATRLAAFSGGETSEEGVLDLNAEVETLVTLMSTVVPRHVHLDLVSGAEDARVRARRVALNQILMNLVLNATESSASTRNVRIEIERPDGGASGRVHLSVVDDGEGLAPELHEQIFDPFFTLKQHGHGIGLASVRIIVEKLGGEIDVQSAQGVGTRVTVVLPEPAAADTGTTGRSAPELVPGGLALIVDDDVEVRATLTALLGQLGWKSLEATGGLDALARLRERGDEVGVVFLDLRMPGMNGWQCLRELRRAHVDVPVVVCSAYDPHAEGAPPDGERPRFLPKPVRLGALRAVLAELAPKDAPADDRAAWRVD